ncbi:MAG: hypothetical protein RLY35_1335 [Bacteroidota bacterium]
MKKTILFCGVLLQVAHGWAQSERNIDLKMYGHMQYNMDKFDQDKNSYFSLGEQDFFVTAKLTDRISFLGETVVKYDAATSAKFAPSIERAQMKWDYFGNHSIIMGKIHTPVNTWNDEYHHGRLFFPTIDRPLFFSTMVPVHTSGVSFRGQYLGRLNFGYDLVIGNGISSTDAYDASTNKAVMAGMHIRPDENTRIGVSYYNDYMPINKPGVHSGHAGYNSGYLGPLNFELYSLSIKRFTDQYEFMSESGYGINTTDSLGRAENFASFNYLGVKVKEVSTIYALADFMHIADNDLHSPRGKQMKTAIGYKYEFSETCNVKFQVERTISSDTHLNNQGDMQVERYDFKFQLAYGF